jgi:glycosyltransferase involved in cell wall biosynthesis
MPYPAISIVVPLYNEEQNIRLLHEAVSTAMKVSSIEYELICVNDGSRDGTSDLLTELAAEDNTVKVINFRRNYGQTAAMMAGFDHSSYDVVVPMDGDLQNDPADISMLLDQLEKGFSVVSGWRKNRKDAALKRNLPSRIANWLISKISGVHLHDYGCTLKAYRKDVLEGVNLYGEMHRFVPIFASQQGGTVTEVVVHHNVRQFGESKYGMGRVLKVILDLMVVKFLTDFHSKPIYVFGGFGLFCMGLSILSGVYALYLRFFEGTSFILTPLPLLVVMTFVVGILSIFLGLLAELLIRIYFEAQGKRAYYIRNVVNIDNSN